MTDRPIIFSAPMVRALLAGRKTQTRRVIKPRPWNRAGDTVDISKAPSARHILGADGRHYVQFDHPLGGPLTAYVLHFAAGGRLWVRETWGYDWYDDGNTHAWKRPVYRADDGATPLDNGCAAPWRPSIYMPRSISRITLTVTDVRVQRLQEMTNADCIAEGISVHPNKRAPRGETPIIDEFARQYGLISYYGAAFRDLWNSIHGAEAWAKNPWVVALTFSVDMQNIDRMGAAA